MDDLKVLVSIIRQQNLKNNPEKNNDETKLNHFEALLFDNKITDDESAISQIYGDIYNTNKYKTLKYRVKERLHNRIFFNASNISNLRSRSGASQIISKNYTIAMVLMDNFQRKIAIPIFEDIFKLSVRFEQTAFCLLCLKQFIYHYGFIDPDTRKFQYYKSLKAHYLKVFEAEQFAENCNADISHIYITKKSGIDKSQMLEFQSMVHTLLDLQKETPSYIVNLITFDLAGFYFLYMRDYEKVIKYSAAAITYFQSLEFEEKLGLLQSYNNIALANLYQGYTATADEYIIKGFDIVTNGSRYWFRQMGIYFLSAVQQKDYDKMYIICQESVANKKLRSFAVEEEQWYIREAYAQFLNRMGKISHSVIAEKTVRPFVLSKFLNSVPFHSKDKQGQNISIIVIQILFLILDRKYNAVIDKVEGLNQYTYRHLKNDETFRSNCFIKMLLQMVKADFHPIRTRTYTEDFEKKLLATQFVSNENSAHIEIIPYDQLWHVVLELLSRNN
jgi:hypothetical protein